MCVGCLLRLSWFSRTQKCVTTLSTAEAEHAALADVLKESAVISEASLAVRAIPSTVRTVEIDALHASVRE